MSWMTLTAIFFLIWWTLLFASLSAGLRTQDEAGEVVPGTVASAPSGRHMGRVLLRNTIVSLLVFGAFYLVTEVYGFGVADLPDLMPDFE